MKSIPIVAGNWKMHKTIEEGISFVGEIQNRILDTVDAKVIFCPPFTALFPIVDAMRQHPFGVGAQNVHHESHGAFTGEISIDMLKSAGVDYVIIGHSERRHVFGETDRWINKKIHAVIESGLIPMFCIGETLEDRQSGQTSAVLKAQIELGLSGLSEINPDRFIVAYEPVWAIGTGETASVEQIETAHKDVKAILASLFETNGAHIPILYGGSVNAKNAKSLIQAEGVDGFLIGGASLKIESFCHIIETVAAHY